MSALTEMVGNSLQGSRERIAGVLADFTDEQLADDVIRHASLDKVLSENDVPWMEEYGYTRQDIIDAFADFRARFEEEQDA